MLKLLRSMTVSIALLSMVFVGMNQAEAQRRGPGKKATSKSSRKAMPSHTNRRAPRKTKPRTAGPRKVAPGARLSKEERAIAAALANSNDFKKLVDVRIRKGLKRRPTKALITKGLQQAIVRLKARPKISGGKEAMVRILGMLFVHDAPVDTTASIVATRLGCIFGQQCLQLGRSILFDSVLIRSSCSSRGARSFQRCIAGAESPYQFVREAGDAAILEHFKAVELAAKAMEGAQEHAGGGGAADGGGNKGQPGGGSLGLLSICLDGQLKDPSPVLPSTTKDGSTPQWEAYAGACESFSPEGNEDFGPAGDPALAHGQGGSAGQRRHGGSAVTTEVSPFFAAGSPCYGLNPAKIFTSQGGGAGVGYDGVDSFFSDEYIAEHGDPVRESAKNAAIEITKAAIDCAGAIAEGMTIKAIVGKALGPAAVAALDGVEMGKAGFDYAAYAAELAADGNMAGAAAVLAIAPGGVYLGIPTECIGDDGAWKEGQSNDSKSNSGSAIKDGVKTSSSKTAEKMGGSESNPMAEGSIDACGQHLTQYYGACVPEKTATDLGSASEGGQRGGTPGGPDPTGPRARAGGNRGSQRGSGRGGKPGGPDPEGPGKTPGGNGPGQGGQDGNLCGVDAICGSPFMSQLPIYASLCGAWDPSPIEQRAQPRLKRKGSVRTNPDCDPVVNPGCDGGPGPRGKARRTRKGRPATR